MWLFPSAWQWQDSICHKYCVQFWQPTLTTWTRHQQTGEDPTKAPGTGQAEHEPYEELRREGGLFDLEDRRQAGDLVTD